MNTSVQFAELKHLAWLVQNDHHIGSDIMEKKILSKQILVITLNKEVVGWLRFSLFWDMIPFINLLFVNKEYRQINLGKKLVQSWEEQMKKEAYKMVMTSSQANENAQHFFRKYGYKDAGSLLLPNEPMEIIFIKNLVSEE